MQVFMKNSKNKHRLKTMCNKKVFRYFIMMTMVLLLSSSDVSLGFALDNETGVYSKIAAKIRPCVVTIIVSDYNGKLKHIGSGFFYNKQGDIISNSHVLMKNTSAKIKTFKGDKYAVGSIIERNEKNDVVKARVHIPKATPFLKTATTYPVVGEKIMVVGSPMGLEQTYTEGIVSAWRDIPGKGKAIQISAPVSPGSSGGPVLNMKGEVVGIAAFQIVHGQNLNFAIPVETIFKTKPSSTKKLKFHKNNKGVIIIE